MYQDLTKISRLVDVWKDAAIKIFSHHPRKDRLVCKFVCKSVCFIRRISVP